LEQVSQKFSALANNNNNIAEYSHVAVSSEATPVDINVQQRED